MSQPWEVVVAGNTNTDVQNAMNEVLNSVSGGVVRKELVFPPGDYRLTQPLHTTQPDNSTMLHGFTVRGAGKRRTRLYWDNPGADPFITAYRRFRFLSMSGMTVTSTNAANEFVYAFSDTSYPGRYNQAWRLDDLEFTGPWKRVWGLDGDKDSNLNSEMRFTSIFTATDTVFSDGFFVSGISLNPEDGKHYPAQNQFLNYWFDGCVLNIKSGTMFKLNRGGSLTVENSSCSAVSGSYGPVTYFHMPNQGSNNPVVNRLSCRHVYFEPKAANHKVIDCSWAGGTVSFSDCCDEGPLQDVAGQEGFAVHRYVGAPIWNSGAVGPSVQYVRHVGAGHVLYEGPTQGRGGFFFEGGNWFRGPTGQSANQVQPATSPVLRWSNGAPRYSFRRGYNYSPTSTPGW